MCFCLAFRMTTNLPLIETIMFAGGLAASVAAGVYGYQAVGLYGDGPFASGYHRERDPNTGESLLVHESVTGQGRIRRVMDQRFRLRKSASMPTVMGSPKSSRRPPTPTSRARDFRWPATG